MTLTQAIALAVQGSGPQCFGRVLAVEGDEYTTETVVIQPDGTLADMGGTPLTPDMLEDVAEGDGWHSLPALELTAEHGAVGMAAAMIVLVDQHRGRTETDIGKAIEAARQWLARRAERG